MKKILMVLVFHGVVLCASAQNQLRVLVIFAHPDEGEIYAGGISKLYTTMGHKVKFMSLTNGDAGHFSMKPEELAVRRRQEAMNAKEILGLSDYEILDNHDGVLKNTKKVQENVIKSITTWNADIVFTFYPAKGGHNDNMTAGWIVREASSQLSLDPLPVFVYMRDFHTASFSYVPDIAIEIDDVWETKMAACGAHESQVIEYNPEAEGVLDEVLASKEKQVDFLFHNTVPFSIVRPNNALTIEKWYGADVAGNVTYVEEFEFAEFGRQISDEEVYRLFPMLPHLFNVSAKATWMDTGMDVVDGQFVEISTEGKILWNLHEQSYCDPNGAVPFVLNEHNPIPSVNKGAIIGKIGEDATQGFFIGASQRIQVEKSGRLYIGINDHNASDNEGFFRARINVVNQ